MAPTVTSVSPLPFDSAIVAPSSNGAVPATASVHPARDTIEGIICPRLASPAMSRQ
jgi:hypothetical protein